MLPDTIKGKNWKEGEEYDEPKIVTKVDLSWIPSAYLLFSAIFLIICLLYYIFTNGILILGISIALIATFGWPILIIIGMLWFTFGRGKDSCLGCGITHHPHQEEENH